MAGEIFISYRCADQAWAQLLHSQLRAEGVEAWYDAQVGAGQDWRIATAKALETSRIFVLLFSENAAQSSDIAKELAAATLEKKLIIPVRLQNIAPKGAFLYELASRNWVNAYEDTEAKLAQLAKGLAHLVRTEARDESVLPFDRADGSGHTPAATARKSRRTPTIIAAAAVLVIAVSGIAAWLLWRSHPPAAPGRAQATSQDVAQKADSATPAFSPPPHSVAVLPFANLTGDATKEYLGDGMAEEVINTLTKVPGLKVPARTSSFAYKGRNVNVRDIGKDLQVGAILEGSVRSAGTEIRITAQLINAQDGLHLWSETYDRKFTDLFKLQDELAMAIVTALQLNLNGASPETVTQAPPTKDVEAYQLTLQGFAALEGGGGPQGPSNALNLFQQAVARDPHYARAYAGIAMAQLHMHPTTGSGQSRQGMLVAAEQAARHALQLDPNSAVAETVLGRLAFQHYDMVEAESHYRRAAASDPSDALLKFDHAVVQAYVGHMRDAVQTMRDAFARAPAIPQVVVFAGVVHTWAGLDVEALKYANLAAALGVPNDNQGLGEIRGAAALRAGRYADYLRDSFLPGSGETAAEREPALELSRMALAAVTDPSERAAALAARARLYPRGATLTARAADRCGYNAARAYVILGEVDAAYDLANQCLDEAPAGQVSGEACPWQPEWRNFRRDPRFQAYIARRGAIAYYEKYGPPDDCELKDGKLTCH
jgi:TolB-like protein